MNEDYTAHEVVNAGGDPSLLIVCDHASNATPDGYGTLGLPEDEFARHIAWDIGTEGVSRTLSRLLDCPVVISRFSRLFIDPNRGEDDPTLIMRLSDGAIIPETEKRLDLCYRPYHAAIDAAIARSEAETGRGPNIISIHSFTRQLRGRPERPYQVGILYDWDLDTAGALLKSLRAEPDLTVGDNEPYHGRLPGDCMWQHATQRTLPHALIEIRNDLIATEAGQQEWGERLAPHIEGAFS